MNKIKYDIKNINLDNPNLIKLLVNHSRFIHIFKLLIPIYFRRGQCIIIFFLREENITI